MCVRAIHGADVRKAKLKAKQIEGCLLKRRHSELLRTETHTMGVRGLTALIDTHSRIYRDDLFGGRRLVIDGCNLLYLLYFDSGLEQNHGGEYAAFEDLIEEFFTALRTCNISPYVVLDGGTDVTGKKLQTLIDRAEDRIRRAHRAAVEGTQEDILPLLVNLVFRQTLEQLEVPLAKCYEEADQEIAALAIEWNCPVLSCDSDFYIFDVPAGLLPFSHFQWRALEQKGSQSFIPCKNYRTSSLCSFFGIQKQLLPTFAVLAGNDYVKQMSTINWVQFCQGREEKWSRLRGLLCWLRSFQLPEEVVEAALELMQGLNKENKQKVRESLKTGMQEYQLPPSSLKKFLTHGTLPPFPDAAGVVPDWIQLLLVKCKMTSNILDVLRLKNRGLNYCVGSAKLPSAHVTSRPLRQVMYGLLLPHRDLNPSVEVVERDRVGMSLRNIPVQPIVTATSRRLHLNSLHKAEDCLRLQVLLEALGVSEASLSGLLPQLRLPVAVTCYWWQNALPCPDEKLLKALLLGLSVGMSQFHKAALQTESSESDSSNSNNTNVTMAHNITQWQICLKDTIHFNELLSLPLPEPQVSRLYEGVFVHRLVQRMTSGKLKNFWKHDVSRVEEYKKMLAIVRQFHCRQPRRRRMGPQRPPSVNVGVDLRLLYDPEEEAAAVRALKDLDLEHRLLLRARHTAKDKRNSNPMMVCKSERRGKDVL